MFVSLFLASRPPERPQLGQNDQFSGVAGLEDLGVKPTQLEQVWHHRHVLRSAAQVSLTFLRKFRNHLFYEQPVTLDEGK